MQTLQQRGRLRESHGMRELYQQSFKDPGSAELLDALLRRRASARQIRDFARYVEDVNRLKGTMPVVVVPTKEGVAEVSENLKGVEPISMQNRPPSPRVVITETIPNILEREEAIRMDLDHASDSHTLSLSTTATLEEVRKHGRRGRRGRRVGKKLKAAAHGGTGKPKSPTKAHAKLVETRLSATSRKIAAYHHHISDARHVKAVQMFSSVPQSRHKKKKQKTFSGANGPVYSPGLFGRP